MKREAVNEEAFEPGQRVFALNPKYKDGTRLRAAGSAEAAFNGVWLPNDSAVEVLELAPGFARVRKDNEEEGWIRLRNLTRQGRVPGVTRDIVTTEIVTPDPEYVRGIKIYNLGIKEDPVPGQKFGKGVQHLISSQWLMAMSEFLAAHLPALRAFAAHALEGSRARPGYDFVYFTNMANQLFHRADLAGLRGRDALDFFFMATWLVMAAAEVDDFPFRKYSAEERARQRADFYAMYAAPSAGPGLGDGPRDDAAALGKFAAPLARRDLIPPIALERLGINNELSTLKYADAEAPLRDGFPISQRIDSLKRHFEGVHRRLTDEDHIIHLLWNFHAIAHVLAVFPHLNDLVDYRALGRGEEAPRRPRYDPTTSLEKIQRAELPVSAALKLDWNEGSIPPPPRVSAALTEYIAGAEGSFLKWYPQLGGGAALRGAIADYAGVIPENLIITNGSDDALILLCQRFLGEGKRALAPAPTYEHFCVNAAQTGAELLRLPLADPFIADADEIAGAVERERPDLLYLVSPNNPTGSQWTPAMVAGLSARFPELAIIVDEAYYEFGARGADGERITCVGLAVESPKVVVTRTFSKAFCLAAVRCGYLIAHPNTVEELSAFYNPKSVNSFAQIAALTALGEAESYYAPYIEATNAARDEFIAALAERGIAARSGGGGNFVCVPAPRGRTAELAARLEEEAIYVRDIGGRFPGFIRVTIGLEMSRVVEALDRAFRESASPDASPSR